MQSTFLDHEQFKGAQVLADIGAKIAAGRAELSTLESSKEEFLENRAQEAITRVKRVLDNSTTLINEIGGYHSELVGYRNEVEGYLADVLYLVQRVTEWKAEFDAEITQKNKDIDQKTAENEALLTQIKGQRALLEGESVAIQGKRASLKQDMVKIRDEWATLGRAQKEINGKK